MEQAQIKLTLNREVPAEKRVYDNLKKIETSQERHRFIVHRLARSEGPSLIKAVRVITGIVGILLLAVSVHFTYKTNAHAMVPFWAFVLSLSLVFFTSFAFTLASYSKRGMALLFYLLWVIGVSYSIFTAVAGQYEDFRGYIAADDVSVSIQTTESIDNIISLHNEQLSKLRESEALYQSILDDLDTPERRYEYLQTWKDTTAKLESTRSDIHSEVQKISELQEQRLSSLSNTIQSKSEQTIYSWLAGVLSVPEDTIHLLVILFPSVFIDLVSGLVFKFALGKKEDE